MTTPSSPKGSTAAARRPKMPLPQSSSSRAAPSSTRYPLHAPPASVHAGDLPSTVIRICRGRYLAARPSGASAARPRVLRVERRLLLGAGEGPRGLRAALLAEGEAQLPRRPQALGMVGPEGRAGLVEGQRAERVAPEVAGLARDLRSCCRPRRHARRVLR